MTMRSRPITARRPGRGTQIEGRIFTGSGPEVVRAIAAHARVESLDALAAIVNGLLVNKGADWTAAILSEYVGLYEDSLGTFSVVWDDATSQPVSHGSVFQSSRHPWAALVAHIRTADAFRGLGLGTLVTEEVADAAFRQGAGVVVLATDDKINRLDQGERAADSLYSRLGFIILGEMRLADTIDRMMVIDEEQFREVQRRKDANDGKLASLANSDLGPDPRQLAAAIRASSRGRVQRRSSRSGPATWQACSC